MWESTTTGSDHGIFRGTPFHLGTSDHNNNRPLYAVIDSHVQRQRSPLFNCIFHSSAVKMSQIPDADPDEPMETKPFKFVTGVFTLN